MISTPVSLRLRAQDRVLVLAPHPDDESIACGGLLLAARAAGAAQRVVMLTDGDNNPWPQRWAEKRWRIDATARARWGARRRAEAQAALDVLGVAGDERFFFGWPDMGLTDLLMREPTRVTQALVAQIDAFRPTHLAIPALIDEHPDHSAVHIAARFALAHAQAAACLCYCVHGAKAGAQLLAIELDAGQRELKQRAIRQHETQMRLSHQRFLAFAGGDEIYLAFEQEQRVRADHPLDVAINAKGLLELRLDARGMRGISSSHLLLAIEADDGQALRWRMPLVADSVVELSDCNGKNAGETYWRRYGNLLRAELKLPFASPLKLGFCKLAPNRAGLVVYDRYGWQTVRRKPL